MAVARTARAWPWVIVCLAIGLVAVLASGAWATWRPLSDHDAARLTARDIVASVGESSPNEIPRDTVDRQLSALGPEATPSQRERLGERLAQADDSSAVPGATSPDSEDDAPGRGALPSAVSRMTELAADQEDPGLAATMAGIAASWSAEVAREDPSARPLMRTDMHDDPEAGAPGAEEASAEADDRCTPELTAVVTQVDRALFTTRSADARGVGTQDRTQALDDWQQNLQRIQEESAVESLYECEPHPARGGYQLPQEIAEDPAAAAGDTARNVSEYAAGALSTAAPDERPWLLDVLESSARAQALLQPDGSVPALVGEPSVTDR